MSYAVLQELRNIISSALPTFNHIIGLTNPSQAKDSDYPFVFYAPERESLDSTQQYLTERYVLLVGIRNGSYDKNSREYTGIKDVLDTAEAIKDAIKNNYTLNSTVIDAKVGEVFTDLGIQHPYYHAEIHVEVVRYG